MMLPPTTNEVLAVLVCAVAAILVLNSAASVRSLNTGMPIESVPDVP